ncbi:putative AP-1 adaptor complex subunit beta [Protomyces lactucae-debilis]|uniref:AP complex subunit beta n=1 Tax=Protomyces lactucae-debilis TaxID=2754530 RepID=A0A1Y2FEV5_PROLT|nr:putative AP-1 adaptor complex subunit beta [Protomyces lactucae-debilis]ORY82451.1 putative AP-1 adaptor complex subunit beta [Protomyces lactucae-debilis]
MSMAGRIQRAVQAQIVPKKGETFELRKGLVSQYASERKEAIQRTIAAMTLGKDVSALFPDVLKNIATPDLAQKKLVYLYLMNYARAYPDLCILAVNTFVQDSEDGNPLVRALAIRTMGCVRVDKMIDYLPEPLKRTLKDESPYVRKTAAICVAKLYDLNPELCLDNGFVKMLQELVGDANATVVANAVSALAEIQEADPATEALLITADTLSKMLVALNECSEWGRIAIMNAMSGYVADDTEAETICERVAPQFQHANVSVVIAAVKVVIKNIKQLKTQMQASLLKKLATSLVTLLSAPFELQYVALRNIRLLLQIHGNLLANEIRVFFCKYNDPLYVKNEKLHIMIALADESNIDQLLLELKEYATEIDMEFVKKAVRMIGLCAIKIEVAAERCLNVLLELINTRVNYVVQESVVVIKDIFRRYPARYESVIPALCRNIDELDDPKARASLIWILGEYAEKIHNSAELLESFMESFKDEYAEVQLQLLTAVVKLFLKKPKSAQAFVEQTLQNATHCDNSDVRDRAFIYWRLLSSDSSMAKTVVLDTNKPPIDVNTGSVSSFLLNELVADLSLISSVYHKPARSFVGGGRTGGVDIIQKTAIAEQRSSAQEATMQVTGQNVENLLDIDFDGAVPVALQSEIVANKSNVEDLLDLFKSSETEAPVVSQNQRAFGEQGDMLDLI